MSPYLQKIADEFDSFGVRYSLVEEKLHVPLPKNFDTLVIEIWNDEGEDSISLLNGVFHTHGDVEANEHGLDSGEKGILHLVQSIFDGSFKMIKRINEKGVVENTIWDSFSLVLVKKDDDFEVIEI
ncbi:hypothetical protein EYS14_01310 [Alteromonadaceae bacterium M269]|nr:hypothetical protein EYS14_01310 [Alteromonadaceae bacterium M269]